MDDKTFDDPKTAQEWIQGIEAAKASLRDQDIYPRLRAWADLASPSEILEIGCGQGICSDKIGLEGRSYTGLEPSPLLLERAKELYRSPNRRFLPGNVYAMPFPDHAFDAVFSVSVWHLLSDPLRAARELGRVLKENAHFLIITANPGAYRLWTDQYTESKLDGRRFDGILRHDDRSVSHDALYLHTLDEMKTTFQAAGLSLPKIETFRPSEKPLGQDYFISFQGRLTP